MRTFAAPLLAAMLTLPFAAAGPGLDASAGFNSGTIKASAAIAPDDAAGTPGAGAGCAVNAPGEAAPVTVGACGAALTANGERTEVWIVRAKCPPCGEELEPNDTVSS